MKTHRLLFGIAGLFFLVGLGFAIAGLFSPTVYEVVPCYDNNGNVILNLVCEEKVVNQYDVMAMLFIPITVLFIMLGFLFWFKDDGVGF